MYSKSPVCTSTSLNDAFGFTYNNPSLFVADYSNNRVFISNKISFTNGQAADLVIGQPDFVSNAINNGGISAGSLNALVSTLLVGPPFFIVDRGNNRILGWKNVPTSQSQSADLVIGQNNFLSQSSGTTSTSLHGPVSAASDGYHFIVDDRSNNRILIWNGIRSSSGPANVVLGQPDFVSFNGPTPPAANTLNTRAGGVTTDGQHLVVGDAGNNRILIWNSIPTTNQQPADLVLGQPNMAGYNANNTPGAFRNGQRTKHQ